MLAQSQSKHFLYFNNLLLTCFFIFKDCIYHIGINYQIL